MVKLNVIVMGENIVNYLPMCLNSIKQADCIILMDGGSVDETISHFNKICLDNGNQHAILQEYFDKDNPKANGKQRNIYLKYLKENHMGEWCLVLDADEVVEDLSKVKEYINLVTSNADDIIMSVRMRHFIHDFGHEDATKPIHYCPHRLFKIVPDLTYPEVEHTVIFSTNKDARYGEFYATTIWHLSAFNTVFELYKRYQKNLKHSNIHDKQFLDNWLLAHITGRYPTTEVNLLEVPKFIFDNFGVDIDRFYFENRTIEVKHFIMAKQWKDELSDKIYGWDVIELGCGRAPFGFAFECLGISYTGIELSKWAVEHSFVPIKQGNILTQETDKQFFLTLVFDVLEHLNIEDIPKAIDTIKAHTRDDGHILISVPTIGDPNLENDKTHKIKEKKCWWIEQFMKAGLKIVPTPDHFLFKEQIILMTK